MGGEKIWMEKRNGWTKGMREMRNADRMTDELK